MMNTKKMVPRLVAWFSRAVIVLGFTAGVTLLLFSPADTAAPARQVELLPAHHKSGRVWHCRIPAADLGRARYYAYRVNGPFAPEEGHRFDPSKVLLDPYARSVYFPPRFDRDRSKGRGSNARTARTSAAALPAAMARSSTASAYRIAHAPAARWAPRRSHAMWSVTSNGSRP